jgi:gliding motility-associated lipoprotein GldH
MKTKVNILIFLLFLLVGCSNLSDFAENKVIKGATWDINDICRYEYLSTDTTNAKDIFINLRHTGMYKYSNIYFFVTTLAPDGKSLKDTVEFTLANARGKWSGSGIGDIYDVELAYKRYVKFGQPGRYIFYVQHGMRDKKLEDVTDVGISIRDGRKE